jgi:5-methylcytosine-specific restriction endonuclease McrA
VGNPTDGDLAFLKKLADAGGEVLATTANIYEVMRFRTNLGTGVVYVNAQGQRTWNREAQAARDALMSPTPPNLCPERVRKHKAKAGEIPRILERDGAECFYCLQPFESGNPARAMAREHLIGRSYGGPNHVGNKVLAHQNCNNAVGALSLPEKLKVRERALKKRWRAEWAAEAQKEPA